MLLLLLVGATTWPEPASLNDLVLRFPGDFGTRRIYLDAGHGAPGNSGNRSVLCQAEQDVMLTVAREVADRLEATGHFDVRLSRPGGARTSYDDRLAAARSFRAEVFISLHSDVRGQSTQHVLEDGSVCDRSEGLGGYSVLWSDEGRDTLVEEREELALTLDRHLRRAGFGAYEWGYGTVYDQHERAPGVYLDRHKPRKRIRFLRRPTMPSVIVETHHAWDLEEARRFSEAETWDALADAIAVGLIEYLSEDG